jgi:hypothetical protein
MMIAVAILAVIVFVLCGVVYELFRDVRQLRDAAGILDRPLDVDIGAVAGTRPSSHGLPEALDSVTSGLVLFLSERCGTCRSIAAGLDRKLPPLLWIVLEAQSAEAAAGFITSYDMASMVQDGKLIVDVDGTIAARIGLDTTPVGFRLRDGRVVGATTVPSKRYLISILPKPVALRRADGVSKEREAWQVS